MWGLLIDSHNRFTIEALSIEALSINTHSSNKSGYTLKQQVPRIGYTQVPRIVKTFRPHSSRIRYHVLTLWPIFGKCHNNTSFQREWHWTSNRHTNTLKMASLRETRGEITITTLLSPAASVRSSLLAILCYPLLSSSHLSYNARPSLSFQPFFLPFLTAP